MLTLTRKEGESIIIRTDTGQEIRVLLSRIVAENQARISIDAAENVAVIREELYSDWEANVLPPDNED